METKNMVVLKCRGIIIHENKLFVAKHGKHADFYALPGGHLEFPETAQACIERELFEELGVKPEVGKLSYVCNFTNQDGTNYVEFIFEIKNGKDYLNIGKMTGTHRFELVDILWVPKNEIIKVMPEKIYQDFNDGIIGIGDVQFITG